MDRHNILESCFSELCQPRILNLVKVKLMQRRKREELAGQNVLSEFSTTDTDAEEAANTIASMGRKLPATKKKGFNFKQKGNSRMKAMPSVKLKLGEALARKKAKKPGKREKENMKTQPKKIFILGSQRVKLGKSKKRPLLTLKQSSSDPWNSNTRLQPLVVFYSTLDVDLCVDAQTYGNDARFNTSCLKGRYILSLCPRKQSWLMLKLPFCLTTDVKIVPFDLNVLAAEIVL